MSLKKFGVPLEGLHTETGPGVYEAAILYSGVLEAADRAVLFKSGVKEIAYRHGVLPSFMAKVSETLPGCSGHVHQSLWKMGSNVFYDEAEGMSALMESYMAGQLHCLPYILPMIAPTVNSYKRLVEGAWAPTTLTWAIDNRTVALRALPGVRVDPIGDEGGRFRRQPLSGHGGLPCGGSLWGQPGLTQMRGDKRYGYADKRRSIAEQFMGGDPGDESSRHWRRSCLAQGLRIILSGRGNGSGGNLDEVVTDWEMKRYFEII